MTDTLDAPVSFDPGPDFDDLPPQMMVGSDDKAPIRCAFPGCSNVTKEPGTKGRAPKFCPEHKGAKVTGATRSTRGGWRDAPDVEATLITGATTLAKLVGLVNQFDGEVLVAGMPRVVHELVELAKTDTGLRKVLILLAQPGKYGPLILAVSAVAIPIMANHHILPLPGMIATLVTPTEGSETE